MRRGGKVKRRKKKLVLRCNREGLGRRGITVIAAIRRETEEGSETSGERGQGG